MQRRIPLLVVGAVMVVAASLAVAWYFDVGHDPVERLGHLNGKQLRAVLAELGEPDRQLEYTMGESPGGEFRVELYNTYPPNDPKARQARIRELQWHRARYSIAVWLHQINGEWVILDTCRWQKGVEF
jgi:hypothetical protein